MTFINIFLASAEPTPDTNLALIGILGTVVVSLFGILNYLLKRSDRTIEKNTEAQAAQANATLELSRAVAKLNTSIVERDAQDREFHKEVMKEFKGIANNFKLMSKKADSIEQKADRNYDAITAKTMHVDTMHVKNEQVEKRTRKS